MSWLGLHVKGLRVRAGISAEQLAERTNVGLTTIKNIESGYLTAPPVSVIERIAACFGTEKEALLSSAPVELVMERTKEVYVVKEIDPEVKLPAWNDVSGVIYVDNDVLRGHNHIAIEIHDDSMLLEGIRKNSVALIRTHVPVKNGDLVMAVYNKESIVRKYFSDGKEILLRAAGKTNDYPDIRMDAEKDKANIIGKLVRWEYNV